MANCPICGRKLGFFGGSALTVGDIGFVICEECKKAQEKLREQVTDEDYAEGVRYFREHISADCPPDLAKYIEECIADDPASRRIRRAEAVQRKEEEKRKEEEEREAQRRAALLEDSQKLNEKYDMILSTTATLEGYRIVKYINIISKERIVGMGFFKGIGASIDASISSLTGGEASIVTDRLDEVKKALRADMMKYASDLGANAIVGIDIENSTVGSQLLMASMNGTAVVVEKI